MSYINIETKYYSIHRCFVPGCDNETEPAMNDIDASFQKYALPKEYSSSEMFGNDEKFDPCQMYAMHEEVNWKNSKAFGFCQSESFDNSTIMATHSTSPTVKFLPLLRHLKHKVTYDDASKSSMCMEGFCPSSNMRQ